MKELNWPCTCGSHGCTCSVFVCMNMCAHTWGAYGVNLRYCLPCLRHSLSVEPEVHQFMRQLATEPRGSARLHLQSPSLQARATKPCFNFGTCGCSLGRQALDWSSSLSLALDFIHLSFWTPLAFEWFLWCLVTAQSFLLLSPHTIPAPLELWLQSHAAWEELLTWHSTFCRPPSHFS